jgi:hypothetical protein
MSIITIVITGAWLVATGHRTKGAEPDATDGRPDQHTTRSSWRPPHYRRSLEDRGVNARL